MCGATVLRPLSGVGGWGPAQVVMASVDSQNLLLSIRFFSRRCLQRDSEFSVAGFCLGDNVFCTRYENKTRTYQPKSSRYARVATDMPRRGIKPGRVQAGAICGSLMKFSQISMGQ